MSKKPHAPQGSRRPAKGCAGRLSAEKLPAKCRFLLVASASLALLVAALGPAAASPARGDGYLQQGSQAALECGGTEPGVAGRARPRSEDQGGAFAFRRRGGFVRADNPAQGIWAEWGHRRSGPLVGVGPWRRGAVQLQLRRWGREGHLLRWRGAGPRQVGCLKSPVDAAGKRCSAALLFEGQGLVEWWKNGPAGLQHGFEVRRRPRGEGPIRIDLAVQGARVSIPPEGRQAILEVPDGRRLVYGTLHAWDAAGRRLEARVVARAFGLSLIVEDEGAAYPLVVDPFLSTPTGLLESTEANAEFGCSVASAGDVDGDGYTDVVVGACGYSNGEAGEGAAYLYRGSATGLSTVPDAAIESNQSGARLGPVASAGDVNGDGYADVIVGAPSYSNGQSNEGAAFVYLGSPTGLGTTPAWMGEYDQANAGYGQAVATAGDVNGDGYDDILVGIPAASNSVFLEGVAVLYLGSPTGPSSSPDWLTDSDNIEARYGRAVASAGDVNGDGYDDVLIGAPRYSNGEEREGAAYLYLGSAMGLSSSPAWIYESDQSWARLGSAVAPAGDLNGDGFADVIVGADGYDNGESQEGAAFIFLGSPSGLSSTPAVRLESDLSGAYFGTALAPAGDLDGDGYPDLAVGAREYANGQSQEGAVFVYLGSPTGVATAPSWVLELDQPGAFFGVAIAGAGDVNGDGYDDLVAGAPFYARVQPHAGAVAYYAGGCRDGDQDGVCDSEDNCPAQPNPAQTDTDGDGAGDVCDADDDGDGIEDGADNCPQVSNPAQTDADGDGIGDLCDADADGDGVDDAIDNCPSVANADQGDTDGDGAGDACDADDDGDGIEDGTDNCPKVPNPAQADADGDGIGDLCDANTDSDGDGIDDGRDNCPTDPNPEQRDTDGDGAGDVCDADDDGDGVADEVDLCPDIPDPEQADLDGDGMGDRCDLDDDGDGIDDGTDNCPQVANVDQADTDGDGIGDLCDATTDSDGDGIEDARDNCPNLSNPDQRDGDGDGVGDACDTASNTTDGGTEADGGSEAEGASSGCGCAAEASGDSGAAVSPGLLLLAWGMLRRRRRGRLPTHASWGTRRTAGRWACERTRKSSRRLEGGGAGAQAARFAWCPEGIEALGAAKKQGDQGAVATAEGALHDLDAAGVGGLGPPEGTRPEVGVGEQLGELGEEQRAAGCVHAGDA
ncbi:MAG: hypothetical protein D6729_12165 [Deltaproteobacteria bacterium]|nr:MAG: hypothetical protein D6729_12165 [Deltaproteobacteria bacterium]